MIEILSHTIFSGEKGKDIPYLHEINSQDELNEHRAKLLKKYLAKKPKVHHIQHNKEKPLRVFFTLRYSPDETRRLRG